MFRSTADQVQFVAGMGLGAQLLISLKAIGLAEPIADWVLAHGAGRALDRLGL